MRWEPGPGTWALHGARGRLPRILARPCYVSTRERQTAVRPGSAFWSPFFTNFPRPITKVLASVFPSFTASIVTMMVRFRSTGHFRQRQLIPTSTSRFGNLRPLLRQQQSKMRPTTKMCLFMDERSPRIRIRTHFSPTAWLPRHRSRGCRRCHRRISRQNFQPLRRRRRRPLHASGILRLRSQRADSSPLVPTFRSWPPSRKHPEDERTSSFYQFYGRLPLKP